MRQSLLLALSSLLLSACASERSFELPPRTEARVVDLVHDEDPGFLPSRRNRYAVVLKGQDFSAPVGRPFRISTADDVRREGSKVRDEFVDGDVERIVALLTSKGYDVYKADMGEVVGTDVAAVLAKIESVSDDGTLTFVAYSGEGDKDGLRTRTFSLGDGRRLVTPDTTIHPEGLVQALARVKGTHAVLLNACESGVFADAARKDPSFRGVVVAACAQGYATTPYEPGGTSAIFASFLDLYRDDPEAVKNLATTKLEKAGRPWNNFRHKWVDFWGGGGLPISYDPVVFANADYLF